MKSIQIILILTTGIGIGISSVLLYRKGKIILAAYINNIIENESIKLANSIEKTVINRLYQYGVS